jgi:hypothetical protein
MATLRLVVLFLVVCLGPVTASAAAKVVQIADYFGSYVGVAEVKDAVDRVIQERHMDIEITPFRQGGFRVNWVNVTLVDGRRDLPGVERRVAEITFEPRGQSNLFVEARATSPFTRREEIEPMAGDPLRWAKLDEDGLHVFSFVVLPNGRYELHTYTRRLTDAGLDLFFERVVDGDTLRRIEGRTVRAD